MEAKHTKGPWKWHWFGRHMALVGAHSDLPIVIDTPPRGGMRIRENGLMRPATPDDATHHPDMRLIVQSPQMFNILRECIQAYENHRDAQPTGHLWPDPNHIHHARRIISEVEGASDE